jgi:hypothetical protein
LEKLLLKTSPFGVFVPSRWSSVAGGCKAVVVLPSLLIDFVIVVLLQLLIAFPFRTRHRDLLVKNPGNVVALFLLII